MKQPEEPQAPTVPILVDVRAAAKLLSMSSRWVSGALKAGLIPSVRCGRSRRIDTRDLAAFIEKNKSICVANVGTTGTAAAGGGQ